MLLTKDVIWNANFSQQGTGKSCLKEQEKYSLVPALAILLSPVCVDSNS